MDTTFALLKVAGIGRKVPMHHRMAPKVEVQSLLTDRGRRRHERPERRVERDRHGAYPSLAALVEHLIAEGHREAGAHAVRRQIDAVRSHSPAATHGSPGATRPTLSAHRTSTPAAGPDLAQLGEPTAAASQTRSRTSQLSNRSPPTQNGAPLDALTPTGQPAPEPPANT